MSIQDQYVQIAVDAPLNEPLTYLPLDGSEASSLLGKRVEVPLGRRSAKGVVISTTNDSGKHKLKPIKEVFDDEFIIPPTYLKWLKWLAQYYQHPVGQVANLCFPPLKKATSKRQKVKKSTPIIPDVPLSEKPNYTEEQIKCINGILKHSNTFSSHLLHGITGSGKTEVYLQLLENVIKNGKRGIVLVPEISLTPQLVNRFSARFPGQLAVIHSHLTNREKTNQWWDMLDQKKQILIGARSALFCPIEDLGLIILDEEHEASFKQDEKLKYHARDAAIMLAKSQNCPIVLGSATPSLETWNNAITGKFHLHQMKERVSKRHLPNIHVVDMRSERKNRKEDKIENHKESTLPFWLSEKLHKAISDTLENNQQVALFLNRRGVAQTSFCQSCGYTYECPNCAISLTLHGKNHLVCHYCNYAEPLEETCKECKSEDVVALGIGTELVETDLQSLFPNARLARADRDEIDSREAMEELVSKMENQEIDILIGTQMIAKGLDFPKLQTVGLVMADVGFNLPDFRTSERSFQLLTQVSGRAGRHSNEPGNVYIQTYNPSHTSITYTKMNDFEGFAEQELQARKDFSYPPYGRLLSIRLQGNVHDNVSQAAHLLARRADLLKEHNKTYESVLILGPTPSALSKLRGKYRYHLLIKSPGHNLIHPFCAQLLSDQSWLPPGTKVQIDVDPINML